MHRRAMRYFLFSLPFIFCIVAIRLYYALTDDFRLANITCSSSLENRWSLPFLTEEEKVEIEEILQHPFYYLGKGAQCYAFSTADSKYVIKFFKFKHLKPNPLLEFLPSFSYLGDWKNSIAARKYRKLSSIFNGYDLAYHYYKEGAGLIYIHLSPSQVIPPMTVTLIDKLGLTRQVPLNDITFILQRRGETLGQRLHMLLSQGNITTAQQAIAHILNMYCQEYAIGLWDHDHGVIQNTGFIDDKPFHLDVGKFTREERIRDRDFHKHDFAYVLWKIDEWCRRHYPHLHHLITPFLEEEYLKRMGNTVQLAAVDPRPLRQQR